MSKNILAIETSCDETACALYNARCGIIAERVYSQWKTHAPYGGVVPEMASRDHLQKLLRLIDSLPLTAHPPDAIAYTAGPGLASALLTGATTAQALGMGWGCQVIPVNHLEGHLLSPLLQSPPPSLPYIALLVSGGHTQLYQVIAPNTYALLGETLDDAAGEAFDKSAVLLGLDYPGGKKLEVLAKSGAPTAIRFAPPAQGKFNFSFSGIKTAVRRAVQTNANKADIAASFQQAVADGLAQQVKNALQHSGYKTFCLVGGVAQNQFIAQQLTTLTTAMGVRFVSPHPRHCGDNAAMIAVVAAHKPGQQHSGGFDVFPRWQVATTP